VHEDQLKTAAPLKQDGYSPLIRALDFYSKQGWIMHVFSWVVVISGLLHPPHIYALLQFLEVPHKHWFTVVSGTVLDSVNAFYFLHHVRFKFGDLSAGCLLGTGLGHKQTFLFIEMINKADNLRRGMAGIEPTPSKS
jgi:hypothetical protein